MTTKKLTPAQKQIIDFLSTQGNEIFFHSDKGEFYSNKQGVTFANKAVNTLLDNEVLKIKRQKIAGVAVSQKTIILNH